MSYIICFIVGGLLGLVTASLLAASRDESEREKFINKTVDEFYEDEEERYR